MFGFSIKFKRKYEKNKIEKKKWKKKLKELYND